MGALIPGSPRPAPPKRAKAGEGRIGSGSLGQHPEGRVASRCRRRRPSASWSSSSCSQPSARCRGARAGGWRRAESSLETAARWAAPGCAASSQNGPARPGWGGGAAGKGEADHGALRRQRGGGAARAKDGATTPCPPRPATPPRPPPINPPQQPPTPLLSCSQALGARATTTAAAARLAVGS